MYTQVYRTIIMEVPAGVLVNQHLELFGAPNMKYHRQAIWLTLDFDTFKSKKTARGRQYRPMYNQ